MTKFLTTLMVLLHLCFSLQANRDIHREMLKGLENLDFLYRENKSNISFVSIDKCFFSFHSYYFSQQNEFVSLIDYHPFIDL